MFENDAPTRKNKTDTLNLEQYKKTKAEKKKQAPPVDSVEDTTDSDLEENGNMNLPRSRSKTIAGPVQSIGRKVPNKNVPNIVKTLDLSNSDANEIDTIKYDENARNRVIPSKELSNKRNLIAKEDQNLGNLSDFDDDTGYRTSYRKYPVFPNPLNRQQIHNNSETNGEQSTVKMEEEPEILKTTKNDESINNTDNGYTLYNKVTDATERTVTSSNNEPHNDLTSSVENSSSNYSGQDGNVSGKFVVFKLWVLTIMS